jgi:hypothetical protein
MKTPSKTHRVIDPLRIILENWCIAPQGLLNVFFRDWMTKDIGKHLSFLYNMCATATYTYLPAYKR